MAGLIWDVNVSIPNLCAVSRETAVAKKQPSGHGRERVSGEVIQNTGTWLACCLSMERSKLAMALSTVAIVLGLSLVTSP